MRTRLLSGLLLFSFLAFSVAAAAADVDTTAPLTPAVEESADDDFSVPDDQAEAPLEPAAATKRGFKYGAILEYWFLTPGQKFERMPADPALTGMIDDGKQHFLGSAMQRDNELKNYANRQGVLQWTTYFRAAKPGKHVFLLTPTGINYGVTEYDASTDFSGIGLAINDELKVAAPGERDTSVTLDFAEPGWYKLQILLWWSHDRPPAFQDYGINLKVREPGSLSLRPLARKDLFYRLP